MECVIYNRLSYGGYWRRTFANFVDGILLGIAFNILSKAPLDSMLLGLLEIVVFLAYMIGFKSSTGATPGYSLLRIKIVAINGAQATVKQIVIRLISSLFSTLVFGLGFIWIAFDKDKQSWHDKIAGTYVIRSGAEHIRTMEIPQPSLIRTKVFAFVAFATCLILIGFFGGTMHMMKSSDAYKLSEEYIKENPLIREMVGTPIKFGLFPTGNIQVSAESGEAIFQINVSGDKGKITVVTMFEKKDGQWVITKFGRIDENGNYFDFTGLSN